MLMSISGGKFNADRRVIRTNHAEQDYSIQNLVRMPFLTVRFSTWAKETMRVSMTTNAKLAIVVIARSAVLFVRFGKVGILYRNVRKIRSHIKGQKLDCAPRAISSKAAVSRDREASENELYLNGW